MTAKNPSPPRATGANVHNMTREEFREEIKPLIDRLTAVETKVAGLQGTVWQASLTSVGLVWAVTVGTIGTSVALAKALGLF